MSTNELDNVCGELFGKLDAYSRDLDSDFQQFKAATADPIWCLRDDLQFWLMQNSAMLKAGGSTDEYHQVLGTVQDVKRQQQEVLDRLTHEQKVLEDELGLDDLAEYTKHGERKVEQGIPLEAFDLECPDLDLKASVLQEFILLDEKYVEKLEELADTHAAALKSETGGWSADDHFVYQVIIEQYTYDVRNRWTLILDRLSRHLPHKSRAEFVAHDKWYTDYKYYYNRRKALLNDWQRDRTELLHKAMAVFAEVCIARELAESKKAHKIRQQELCQALYDKVLEWREQKLEMLHLQMEIEERNRKEYEEKRAREEEKERKRRAEEKNQVQEYHDKVAAKRQEAQERDRRRMEELQVQLAKQAEIDQERVRYRDQLQQQKLEAKRMLEQDRAREEAEREDRLEALRQMVRPHVEADPGRVWNETQSWKERLKTKPDEEAHILKPLFEVKTFTSNQITADPRFKVEQRLREAGLHESKYARQVLSTVKPLHAPRPDMASQLFK